MKQPAVPQPLSDAARFSPSAGVPAAPVTRIGTGASPRSPHREFGCAEAAGCLYVLPCQEGVGRARSEVGSICWREPRQVGTRTWS